MEDEVGQVATIERLPPQSLHAEEAVLGSILIDGAVLERLQYMLAPTDFYREKNGWVYEAAMNLHVRHDAVDYTTICKELERAGRLDEVGGPAYVSKLLDGAFSSLHAETYAKEVVRTSNKRTLIGAAQQIAQLGYSDDDDLEAYTKAISVLESASPTGHKQEVAGGSGEDIAQEFLKALALVERDRQDMESGGYEPVWAWNKMRSMARWRRGQPVGLIAEGGAGKTAFCMEIAFHNAINGGRVFYVATEDEPRILWMRRLATQAGVQYRQVESGKYVWEDAHGNPIPHTNIEAFGYSMKVPARVLNAVTSTSAWRGELYIISGAGRTVPEVVYEVKRLGMRVGEPDAIVFDWFLDQATRSGDDSLVNKLTADLKDLKSCARDSRLLVATQTGKGGAGKSRLSAYDAFWTSAFAHYCKLVFTLKRERELVDGEPVGPFKPDMEVFIAKANLDQTGLIRLAMRGETFAIYEKEKIDGPYNH